MEDDIELLRLRAKAKAKREAEQAAVPIVSEEPGMLDYAMRGLNYTGGLGRAAIAGAMEPFVGKDLVSVEQALKGTVPSSSEIMEKAGVPNAALSDVLPQMYSETGEGLALEKGGMFDPTARGTVGFGLDIAADPATYLVPYLKGVQVAGVASKAAKASRLGELLLNPLGEAVGAAGKGLKKGGEELYKSAFEKADRALATRYGKGSIADILKSEGFKGSAEEALTKTAKINESLGSKIGDYRIASEMSGILEKPLNFDAAEKVIKKYRSASDPKMMSIADDLQKVLESYKTMPPKTATELATVKRVNLDMAGGDTAFDMLKSSPDRAESELRRALGKSLGEAEDSAVKQALSPEEYADYLKTKKDYGVTTKFGQKQLATLANQEAVRTGVAPSAVDVMGTFAALASGQPLAVGGMAAKKGRDILRLTGSKTRLGPMMESVGEGVQTIAKKVPPQVWIEMLRNKQGEEQ